MSEKRRIFRTSSGSYEEGELAVLVWPNSGRSSRPNARILATITDQKSPNPVAFPIKMLRAAPELSTCPVASLESVSDDISSASQSAPVIIPLPIARQHLGWTEFYIPTEYQERKK